MSNIDLSKDKLELEFKDYIKYNSDNIDNVLQQKYNELCTENNKLIEENQSLKDIIVKKNKQKFANSIVNNDLLKSIIENPKSSINFYIQIILGIFIIILSLGFHILYLAVTSCLMYKDEGSSCWAVSWLGIDLHASFYIDIVLYSLICIQVILIILIIQDKFKKSY
ncbi:MAG: hypothetical protein ACFFC3_05145 [Candidatus Odinarchaeota archaeon]